MILSRLSPHLAICLLLCGCDTFDIDRTEPIATSKISEVLKEVRRQVSYYELYANNLRRGQLSSDRPEDRSVRYLSCGRGDIDFTLSKVNLDLTTETDRSFSASIDVAATSGVGGGFGFGFEGDNTQELKFTLYPENLRDYSVGDVAGNDEPSRQKPNPIAVAILNLRDALISSTLVSKYGQKIGDCFSDIPPDKKASGDDVNTYKLGLKITTTQNGDISVGLAPIDAKLSASNKSITGNTITVTFAQTVPPKRGTIQTRSANVRKSGVDILPRPDGVRRSQADSDNTMPARSAGTYPQIVGPPPGPRSSPGTVLEPITRKSLRKALENMQDN